MYILPQLVLLVKLHFYVAVIIVASEFSQDAIKTLIYCYAINGLELIYFTTVETLVPSEEQAVWKTQM